MNFRQLLSRAKDAHLQEWTELFIELGQRLYRPIFQPTYVLYFLVSLAIGAAGIWVAAFEALLEIQSQTPPQPIWVDARVFSAMLTYFAALGSLSCIHVIVVEDRRKHLRTLMCFVLVALLLLTVSAAVFEYQAPGAGNRFLTAATIVAVLTWWMANWDETKYMQHSMDDPLGGDYSKQAAGDDDGGISL